MIGLAQHGSIRTTPIWCTVFTNHVTDTGDEMKVTVSMWFPPACYVCPLPLLSPWLGVVDMCASRQLLLTSTEAEGRFHGLSGHPVLPQPGHSALCLQPELLMGKAGGAPYFWECRSGGMPGFPAHGPVTGQYCPAEGLVGSWLTGWMSAAEISVNTGQMD